MSGLIGSDLSSFRPDDTSPKLSLPRRVLRHLFTAHSIGIGSQILITGDEAGETATFCSLLGIDASTTVQADSPPERYDAALWIDLSHSNPDRRSLCSSEVLRRSEDLMQRVRPRGTFLYVTRIAAHGTGHEAKCLEAHFAQLADRSQLTVFPDRSFVGFFGGPSRSGFAVGACQTPASQTDPEFWSRHRIERDQFAGEACCAWSADSARSSRAA